MKTPIFRYTLGSLIALLLLLAPLLYYNYTEEKLRNFRVVREGVLYRSGQLTPEGLKQVIHDYRIKTVVTLRAARQAGEPHPDRAEEEYCVSQELNYYRLPPKPWSDPDGEVPAEENVQKFLEIMNDAGNYPVLVHCYAGKHRTGAFCATYRMSCEGWSNAQAIKEMVACGYDLYEIHADVQQYLTSYQPHGGCCCSQCRHEDEHSRGPQVHVCPHDCHEHEPQ